VSKEKIRVAVVGLGFGKAFVPIYKDHPNIAAVAICDTNRNVLDETGDLYEIDRRYTDYHDILGSGEYDAVHLITPIPLHARQTIEVLRSGKHCACTVPMAISLDDIHAIISAQKESGKNYMMMETAVYTREYFQAKTMRDAGDLGRIQFLRGAHYQDMENWPDYWLGLPPMYYATHAIAPIFALAQTRAVTVHCFGSGRMRPELQKYYRNPFPIETAIFQLAVPGLAAEVTRSLFDTAVGYVESFSVYGDKMSFEWPQSGQDGKPMIFEIGPIIPESTRGRDLMIKKAELPDRKELLPPEIAQHTHPHTVERSHRAFIQGGGHGGSHPHLVNEFVMSIIEKRKPWVDEIKAADWTAAGICAHESAMNQGKEIRVPCFIESCPAHG